MTTTPPAVPPESPRHHIANAIQGLTGTMRTPLGNRFLPAREYDSILARLTTALAQIDAANARHS